MPRWFKRTLFAAVAAVALWLEGHFIGPFGFNWVAVALVITVILAIGWMRTYWKGEDSRKQVHENTDPRA